MSELVDQPTPKPIRKVTAGGIGGALSIVAIWALREYVNIVLPVEVATAATALVTSGVAYLVKERRQ